MVFAVSLNSYLEVGEQKKKEAESKQGALIVPAHMNTWNNPSSNTSCNGRSGSSLIFL